MIPTYSKETKIFGKRLHLTGFFVRSLPVVKEFFEAGCRYWRGENRP
jgi:hypothetical protein